LPWHLPHPEFGPAARHMADTKLRHHALPRGSQKASSMQRLLFAMLIVTAAAVGPASAETVYARGMQVGMVPAGDLKPSTQIPGFEDQDRKVAVGILELPPPAYEELQRSLFGTPPAGMSGIKRETFPFEEGLGYLLTAHGTENGASFQRYLLLANASVPASNFVMLVNVTVPDTAEKIYSEEAVRRMLASITFRKPPIEERLAMMPFKVNELAGFHVMQVLAAGGVILTDGPQDDITRQPYVIVSVGRGEAPQADDRERFARELLSSAPLRDLTVKSMEEMRITGRPGFEIRAQAIGIYGEPVSLVQWVRFNGGSFVRIVGASRSEQWDQMFNRFRAVRDGVEIR